MTFPDFHYPDDALSFPPQSDVLNYLHSYANQFDLKKLISFNHLVVRVAPVDDDKWEVVVKNLPNNTFDTNIFDAIFICNGHYSDPQIPNIPGAEDFRGKLMHSHDFRTAEAFRGMFTFDIFEYLITIFALKTDQTVLVIGGGSSGNDIVAHLGKTASQVTFSQHKIPNEKKEDREKRESVLPKNTKLQDDVAHFTGTGAEFIDGSHQAFDSVIFATGNNFVPFRLFIQFFI